MATSKKGKSAAAPEAAVGIMEASPLKENAMGGGLEGAERNSLELARWNPVVISPDRQINPVKEMADARGRDSVQNDGLMMGAIHTQKDSIIGTNFRLICEPNFEMLGATAEWAEEFASVVEPMFNLLADSPEGWFDAGGTMTLTDMLRLSVGGYCITGEVLQTVEWLRDPRRPFHTSFQSISPSRLSNPNFQTDDLNLRRGIQRDQFGRPLGYYIRSSFPNDFYIMEDIVTWKFVPAMKPWGRRQVIHIAEKLLPDQSRGVADMVSVLKEMKMTKKFKDITLQNAVVNATYAMAVESELPSEVVFAAMGAGGSGLHGALGQYMDALNKYVGGSNNIAIDGVKMPHLFPGTKLNMQNVGTPGGVGTSFEDSLLRHIAAPLGMSFEEFSKDFSKTNYSSVRAAMIAPWKFVQGRKKSVADRQATMIYVLWFEEMMNADKIPLPPGKGKEIFYDPIMREALCACSWIGSSRGQIDEVKETQAALMRIGGGLSTYQRETALLGDDYRKVFAQKARENVLMKKLDLQFSTDATKPGTNDRQQTMNGNDAQQQDQQDQQQQGDN